MAEVLREVRKIDGIQKDVTSIKVNMDEMQASLLNTQMQLSEACEEIAILKAGQNKVDRLQSEIVYLKAKTELLEKKIEQQDKYSRRENMVVKGIPESAHEDCQAVINNLFTKLGVGPFQLQRVHRLGFANKTSSRPRPIIVRFVCFQDKMKTFLSRGQLRGTNIYLQDDLAPDVEKRQQELRPVLNHIRKTNPNAKAVLVDDKLRFEGRLYTRETVKDIPMDMTAVGTSMNDSHVFFSGEYSPLSNLYPCSLIIDDREYKSVEQYYQYHKCMQNGKPEIAKEILQSSSPRNAMYLGKQVKVSDDWCKSKGCELFKTALSVKAKNVKEFSALLLSNKEKMFAEATRHPIWGIGLPFSDKEKEKVAKWSGLNIMGHLIKEIIEQK